MLETKVRYGSYPKKLYPEERREQIGKRLKEIRTQEKLTLSEWAELLEVCPTSVYNWEKAISIPNKKTLKKISLLTNHSMTWLLGGE